MLDTAVAEDITSLPTIMDMGLETNREPETKPDASLSLPGLFD
jgi:hypothetical protein